MLALAVRTVRAELEPGTRRGVDWLIAGAALSVIPVLATEPADRLFLVPSVGLSAALAAILVRGWSSWKQPSGVSPLRRWSLVGLSGTLAVVHLVLSPVQVLTTQVAIAVQSRRAEQAARLADLGPGGEDGPDVVVVSAPDFVAGRYLPVQRWHLGLSVPRSWHVLSLAPHDHRLTRTDASSLELEVLDGEMMTTVFEKLYRPPRPFLRPGDRFAHGPLKVEILRVRPGGGPDRVSYRFDRNLDDPSLFVIGWQGGAFRRLALPEVGGTMVLPRGVGPVGF